MQWIKTFAGLQLSLIKWDFTQIPTDFSMDRILSIISKKFRQWQNIGLTQHSAGSSQLQPEVMRGLNSASGWTNPKQNKVSEKLTNRALGTRNFLWNKYYLILSHLFPLRSTTHFQRKYSTCQHIRNNKIPPVFLKKQRWIIPQECSHRGSLPSRCHPGAAVSCTWSLCRRSCPPCRQPAAPPGWCDTPRARYRRLGPAPSTSSAAARGRMLGRCRISAHPHRHLSAGKESTRLWAPCAAIVLDSRISKAFPNLNDSMIFLISYFISKYVKTL